MITKGIKLAKSLVRAAGLELLSIAISGGGHIRAVVRAQDGRQTIQIFPSTASDRRAVKNRRADLRRFARGQTCK